MQILVLLLCKNVMVKKKPSDPSLIASSQSNEAHDIQSLTALIEDHTKLQYISHVIGRPTCAKRDAELHAQRPIKRRPISS